MSRFLALLSVALAFAASTDAAADLPPIPADKTTPIHQRLSLKGPKGECKKAFYCIKGNDQRSDSHRQQSLLDGTLMRSWTNPACPMAQQQTS